MPPVALVEASLRHGQQTLLLSRLRSGHAVALAADLDRLGAAALDVFGGATFEASLRFLAENPFDRLRALRAAAPRTPLLALLRGQGLTGHRQQPDDVVDAFVAAAAGAGVDVFRCYDSLNDPRNLERVVGAVHAAGRRAEAAMIYSESPVHSVAGFVALGVRCRDLGYDALCIYDPAGLLGAGSVRALVAGLVEATGLPVTVHCAALTGMAGLTYLAAVEAGASGLDVSLAPLAGGSSLPASEALVHALRDTVWAPGWDEEALSAAGDRLGAMLGTYREIADPAAWRHDTSVLRTQLPPTAVEHLLDELRERDALGRLPEVQAEIPRVRAELGFPPLITPISQIVATQAVYNVCDGDRYATISQEVKDYCLGLYGEPPGPIDADVRRVVNGREEPITCRPADLLEPAMAALRREMKREGVPVPDTEAVVLYALFPDETAALLRGEAVAEPFGDQPEPAPAPGEAVAEPDGAAATGAIDEAGAAAPPAAPATQTRELVVEVDGEVYAVRVTAPGGSFVGAGGDPSAAAAAARGGDPAGDGAAPERPSALREGTVVAPMQGLILKVAVKPGDSVRLGDTVAVLEAMKMQNDVTATRAGTVTEVYVAEGTVVSPRDPLVLVE